MSSLKRIFYNTLLEQDVPAYNPKEDEAALKAKLAQSETPPNALDIAPGPGNTGYKAEVDTAKGWISKIDEFVKYLNDTESGSINAQVNTIDRDNSVFKGIAAKVSDKLARISSDLAELKEIFAGFIISADRKAGTIAAAEALDIEELPLNEQHVELLSRYGFELSSVNENTNTITMVLKHDNGTFKAEINENGLVNGEDAGSYLERLLNDYGIEEIIEEDTIGEDIVMDEKILKQIKDIDEKLTNDWDQDLYLKRRELVNKMQKSYLTAAKGSITEAVGDRGLNTYAGWKRAAKLKGAVKFEGDKDICQAFNADGKGIGEWDGEKGWLKGTKTENNPF